MTKPLVTMTKEEVKMFDTETKARCFQKYPVHADVPASKCACCYDRSDCGKTEEKYSVFDSVNERLFRTEDEAFNRMDEIQPLFEETLIVAGN
jgi:hypothetical protein